MSKVKLSPDGITKMEEAVKHFPVEDKDTRPRYPGPNSLVRRASVFVGKQKKQQKQIFNMQSKEMALRQRVAGGSIFSGPKYHR